MPECLHSYLVGETYGLNLFRRLGQVEVGKRGIQFTNDFAAITENRSRTASGMEVLLLLG